MFIIYVILLNCSLLTLKLDRCANDLKMLSSQLRSIETRKHYPIKENVINSAKKIYLKLENLIEKQPTSLFSNKDTFMIDMFSVYCKFANEIKRRFIGSIDHRTFCKALEELCFECKNLQAKRKETTRKKEN